MEAAVVEGFVKAFLLANYNEPKPVPQFHRDLWDLCCLDKRRVAIAAPRGFAKSTCVTHAYLLCRLLFRESRYAVIVSDTEGQAVEFLIGVAHELETNDGLREAFGVKKFLKRAETDVIVMMDDGWQFRIIARGSEQKVRGRKWHHTRPDLIICDDLENDEIVMNADRRQKFRNWFFKALLPSGSDSCVVRVVGTVLHFDSLLERLLNSKNWASKRFAAHRDYDDFSDLLWPEKWPESRLREERAEYETQNMPEGYSQEYLNHPIAEANAYFKKSDFVPMKDGDREKRKTIYALGDLAISQEERADSSAFGVVGIDEDGVMYVLDAQKAKLDGWEIVEKMFEIQRNWRPQMFGVEEEKIKKAIGPFLNREMVRRNLYISLPDPPLVPSKDKRVRARAIQARMRAGGVRFDCDAEWFPALMEEMLRFPRGGHDDYVDMLSWAGALMDRMVEAPTDAELEDEEFYGSVEFTGRSAICGY